MNKKFWKSIAICTIGTSSIIFGVYLFERSLLFSIILFVLGTLVICLGGYRTEEKPTTYINVFGDLAGTKGEDSQIKKDKPFNPWDEISGDKK